jgi:DNA helicase-2/ATP-dependent DNA helicase PcrA
VLEHYQQRWRYLLIDEFQDTNTLQYAWIRVLAGSTGQVFVVGDDDQAIYGWRGAKVENVQQFLRDFPGARTIKLEQNYRSTSNILKAANSVIARNGSRLGKQLWTAGEDGERIALYAAYNEQDEARFVIERIREYIAEHGSAKDCAILYRSNAQSRNFEEQLIQRDIQVSRLRRPALLRARRSQGCAGVSAPHRQSARRRRVRARGEHAAARHRRPHARRIASPRAWRQHLDVGNRTDRTGSGSELAGRAKNAVKAFLIAR